MKSDMEYIAEGKEAIHILLNRILPTDELNPWVLLKQYSDGLAVSSKESVDGPGLKMFKGEVDLPYPAEVVYSAVDVRKPYRNQWDKLVGQDGIRTIRHYGNNVWLCSCSIAPVRGLFSPRDTIGIVTLGDLDDGFFLTSRSTEHPDFPELKGSVRAIQYTQGYRLYKTPGNPDSCRFIMIVNADMKVPGGYVGTYLWGKMMPTLMNLKLQYLRSFLSSTNPNGIDTNPGYEKNDWLMEVAQNI